MLSINIQFSDFFFFYHSKSEVKTNQATRFLAVNGGAMRDRTADLLDANQALSQLSYSPI